MPSFFSGLAKGLQEPCPPYREAYFFGAALNEPSAEGWNCLPELVSATTSFDLSTINKGREVAVALLTIRDIEAGSYLFTAKWYRNRDNALLFSLATSYLVTARGHLYSYSYIGYVDWEINENGGYQVELSVTGDLSYHREIQFTVSGIVEVVPEPVPGEGFFPTILEKLNMVSSLFYQAYYEVYDWVWPFNNLATPLYFISDGFNDLAWSFSNFAVAWDDAVSRIAAVLTLDNLRSYLFDWLPRLEDTVTWFGERWDWFLTAVTDWWSSTMGDVQGWISDAITSLQELINGLSTTFQQLNTAWDNFKDRIPVLDEVISWWSDWTGRISGYLDIWWSGALLEVQGLIDSAFTVRESLWAGWQDWRNQVAEFFSDPEDWLYRSVDRIIERFW